MAVVIRRPSSSYPGIPHGAIAWRVAPVAVIIQFLVSDDVRRQIAGGRRAPLTVVAVFGPSLERVGRRHSPYIVRQLIGARKLCAVARAQRESLASSSDFSFAVADHGPGSPAIRVGIEAIFAFAQDGDRKSTRLNSSHLVISY